MYERFTDRARKVMQLANLEAQRFNHEYIGTEHILLGLVSEGTGVGAKVLKNLDVDLRGVRAEVEKIVQAAPYMIAMQERPKTPRAKRVLDFAIDEARGLKHNYVGTEHLLLGLLREGEGVAAQVLLNLGLELSRVRDEVIKLVGPGTPTSPAKPPPPADESFTEKPLHVSAVKSSGPQPVDLPPGLPLKASLAVDWLSQLIEAFVEMKEDAVAREDFERAATLRDHEKKLRKIREWLLQNKQDDQTA